MADKPSSDPAKPGSKLAQIRALGRRGGIRQGVGRIPLADGGAVDSPSLLPQLSSSTEPTVKTPSRTSPKKRAAKPPVNAKPVAKRKATKDNGARAAKAKRVLKRAEADAKAKRGRPKAGRAEPWKAAGISRAKYYRDQKAKPE